MSDHLKRLNAPDSWHIAKKTTKFVAKTAPGPHNANAMPVAVGSGTSRVLPGR